MLNQNPSAVTFTYPGRIAIGFADSGVDGVVQFTVNDDTPSSLRQLPMTPAQAEEFMAEAGISDPNLATILIAKEWKVSNWARKPLGVIVAALMTQRFQ